ncbi:MAG: MoaD/ThiS family protein [Halothiobacillus sp.]|jgi:molybdopterin synthase sulfur carrier subunit|uniref:MoaD/ThiS family protein n=1 Tax=Halothiobacillus sp. TaxID=1891311 RepID=UPI002AD3644C|nr:MoaD/ThiS family protein [Halothiobacillus sp.]MDA3878317.1 MoaD/ThiS family protein [Halothiobacillus sp.]
MSVTVKFFAGLREQIGIEEIKTSNVPTTVRDAWQQVTDRPRPANILAAVNHEYVDFEYRLTDGDELAFFPPVTGG